MSGGTFRTVLKHQPDIKTAVSGVSDGGTDLDITWTVNTGVTSTDNFTTDQKLIIAPNPVRQEIRLLTENIDVENSEVVIYNTLGVIVKQLQTNNAVIPVQELTAGHYFLSIKGDTWFAMRRFSKIN